MSEIDIEQLDRIPTNDFEDLVSQCKELSKERLIKLVVQKESTNRALERNLKKCRKNLSTSRNIESQQKKALNRIRNITNEERW